MFSYELPIKRATRTVGTQTSGPSIPVVVLAKCPDKYSSSSDTSPFDLADSDRGGASLTGIKVEPLPHAGEK